MIITTRKDDIMFEMFITVVAAIIATVYGVSNSVLMHSPHRHIYWAIIISVIVLIIIIYNLHHLLKRRHLRRLDVDADDYYYYDKFTSILYRIGYLISYLIQNILFDYKYMQRNFNFCKGLDVYDGGVSEYYIKFRNTWYRYLPLTLLRHRISLSKLKAFACTMKNDMILDAMTDPAKKAAHLQFTEEVAERVEKHPYMNRALMEQVPGVHEIDSLYKSNLRKYWTSVIYAKKKEPKVVNLVERQNFRGKRDVTDYKKMDFR